MTVTVDAFRLISRAQGEYARCIDGDRIEEWPDFFEEDCHYRITTAANHREGLAAGVVWADNRRMLADRVSALREANIYEAHTYRHILGQPAVLEESDEGARSETGFLVVRVMRDGTTDIFASGRYLDRYRFTGDRASIVERIVVCDSSTIDTLLALPL
ncbi:aromatic-ring-hydroxylating dioxygenase subunit beta [Streptomyces sp. NPDC096012]|uniref:aromatic-ring-hydroxylating dioxygenase subunit beta n=1 Tax=Streptomyces sp. NPDC096012 TaxID=3155684 RepID=UPI00336AB386